MTLPRARILYFLSALLAAGLVLRVFQALSLALIYPDEQFQTLEPASHLIFGFGTKTWEWYHGVRSWFVPALYLPLLTALKGLGVEGGPIAIQACRILMAALSGLALWRFIVLLYDRKVGDIPLLTVVALMSFSGAMIAWSASTFSETWASILLWTALPFAVKSLESNEPKKWFFSGVMLGLSLLARIQLLAWFAGLIICLLWRPQDRKRLPRLIAGYGVSMGILGLIDWATWGIPFYSVYKNIRMNLFEGVAAMNGVSSWWHYFELIHADLGAFVLVPLTIITLAALGARRLRLTAQDWNFIFPSLFFVLTHFLIGHKETRFLIPAYPAFFYFMAIALNSLPLRRVRPLLATGCAALLLVAGVADLQRVRQNQFDLSALSLAALQDGLLTEHSDSCFALVDLPWVWTRGEMIMKHAVKHVEFKSTSLEAGVLASCAYAMTAVHAIPAFEDVTTRATQAWTRVMTDQQGRALYRNEAFKEMRLPAADLAAPKMFR